MSKILQDILGFLGQIGIAVREGDVREDPFLPGVRIACGELVFDRERLRWPGDLLHEAGHIAVTPLLLRANLDDKIETESRAANAGEIEAIAWSYAAIMHLQLDPEILFHAGGYRGQSRGLLFSFALGVYPGAFGLAQAGMTLIGQAANSAQVAPYPHMIRWLRE